MGFSESVLSVFGNYATFDGRAGRAEYWYWWLFQIILSIVVAILDAIMGTTPVLYFLLWLAIILPSLAVWVRRLHDVDKSGWNLLWSLVPILGPLYLLYLTVQPSDSGANSYGDEPA